MDGDWAFSPGFLMEIKGRNFALTTVLNPHIISHLWKKTAKRKGRN
jgi:hypothetical protein